MLYKYSRQPKLKPRLKAFEKKQSLGGPERWVKFILSLHTYYGIARIAKRTITKNRFVSVRSHETPRTESDKHGDQNKANVWAGAAVVILEAKIFSQFFGLSF